MTNEYQKELGKRLNNFNLKRPEDINLLNTDKLKLIKFEIVTGEIFVILKKSLGNNIVDELIALCIYIEAIIRGYSNEEAFIETEKQMKERK